jgi:hypothetical protein
MINVEHGTTNDVLPVRMGIPAKFFVNLPKADLLRCTQKI